MRRILKFLIFLIIAFGVCIWYFTNIKGKDFLIIVVFFLIIIGTLLYIISELSDMKYSSESSYRKYLTKELNEGENKNKQFNKDIIALMLKNNDEINEYFTISKSQAKVSYWISVFSSLVGLLMLVVASVAIFENKISEVAIIGIISGSITEVISGITLWIHNKSILQLNHYYESLHENEKFLSAINMAERLGGTYKEKAYMEIVRAQIGIYDKIQQLGENNKS